MSLWNTDLYKNNEAQSIRDMNNKDIYEKLNKEYHIHLQQES